jgi:hypothetical protein
MTDLYFIGALIGFCFVMAGILILAVKDGAKRNEQLAQSKREKEIITKQVEVANELTEIANDAPITRADAINGVRASTNNPKQ